MPRTHVENTETGEVQLGAWVSYVRHRQRKGHLSTTQVQELATLPNWQYEPLPAGRTGDSARDALILEKSKNGARVRELSQEFGLTRQRIHQIISAK